MKPPETESRTAVTDLGQGRGGEGRAVVEGTMLQRALHVHSPAGRTLTVRVNSLPWSCALQSD